jgi:hypothetical protein
MKRKLNLDIGLKKWFLFGEDKYERYIGRVQRLEPHLPEFCNINITWLLTMVKKARS